MKEKMTQPAQAAPNVTHTVNDDEIDLLELALQLWRGKFIILLFVLVATFIAWLYVGLKPVSYQSTATIASGRVDRLQPFFLADNLLEFSKIQYSKNTQWINKSDAPTPLPKKILVEEAYQYTKQQFLSNSLRRQLIEKWQAENKQNVSFNAVVASVEIDKKDKSESLLLSYSDDTPESAQDKLMQYINFVQAQTLKDFKQIYASKIDTERRLLISKIDQWRQLQKMEYVTRLNKLKDAKRIAQSVNQVKPAYQEAPNMIFNEKTPLFLYGTKAIDQQITLLKEKLGDEFQPLSKDAVLATAKLKTLNQLSFDDSALQMVEVRQTPSYGVDQRKKALIFLAAAFLGVVLGCLFVLFFNALKNRNYENQGAKAL